MRIRIVIGRQNTRAKTVVVGNTKLAFTRDAKAVIAATFVSCVDMEDASKVEDACKTAVPSRALSYR